MLPCFVRAIMPHMEFPLYINFWGQMHQASCMKFKDGDDYPRFGNESRWEKPPEWHERMSSSY